MYSAGRPSPDRARYSSVRPLETWPRDPSAPCQSRTSVRGGRPASTAAITAGQASCVDANRPRILFDGINRSEYPKAPSMTMPNPSGVIACIPFALRGAPCGDDSRAWPAFGGYHDEESTKIGPADRSKPLLEARVLQIGDRPRKRVVHGCLCLIERHAMLPFVLAGLVRVPIEVDHAPDTTDLPSPASYRITER